MLRLEHAEVRLETDIHLAVVSFSLNCSAEAGISFQLAYCKNTKTEERPEGRLA